MPKKNGHSDIKRNIETKVQYLIQQGYEEYISAAKMFIDYPIFGIGTNTFRFQ